MNFATKLRPLQLLVQTPQCVARRFIQVPISDVRRGQVLDIRSKLYIVLGSSHHRQGRGGAHYKLELKELLSGTKASDRLNSGTMVEAVDLDKKDFQFLYADDNLHVLDAATFEEHEFPVSLVAAGEKAIPFLQESMNVKVEFYKGTPVLIKIPEKGVYTIKETVPPAHSANESSKGTVFKQAVLDNDMSLNVPEFVNMGDQVEVDLNEQKYLQRVSKGAA